MKEIEWSGVYRTELVNIFEAFYKPALERAVQYDRAVGYFSSQALISNLKGLSGLVKNKGKMRLIIGHPLEEDEFESVRKGRELARILKEKEKDLEEIISNVKEKHRARLELLSYLIASDRLEVKFAFRKKGMYHEKIGIIYDNEKNNIVFSGSSNETIYGLTPEYNAESISVYRSWDEHAYKMYGREFVESFEKLWNGKQVNTVTVSVPSDMYSKISKSIPVNANNIDKIIMDEISSEMEDYILKGSASEEPEIPKMLNGKEFEIRKHQLNAMTKWKENDFTGIFKLSTGSGKTITAIYSAVKIFKARSSKGYKTTLIVSVPYKELAKQWIDNLENFNIKAIRCWDSYSAWYNKLGSEIMAYNKGAIDFLALVVVNRTMEGHYFKSLIKSIDSSGVIFIGDECHNHGSTKTAESLPNARYRIGLSATPFRSDEDEIDSPFPQTAKENIIGYYGDIVSEYSLGDAINDGVLCEYEYHIIPVYLTAEEQEQYEELSLRISALINKVSIGGCANEAELTSLCGKRSRLLGSAENKLIALSEIALKINPENRKYTLFYCGEGKMDAENSDDNIRVIEKVSQTLSCAGWKTSRFTSVENAQQRSVIMRNFSDGVVDALVSMKVLDEGVDVPVCDKAFILASTRNPRQYIQRRGRVLRKHPGKNKAVIYDFVTLPSSNTAASTNLIKAELERIDDFATLAKNRFEVEKEIEALNLRSRYV
ncbi:MAG: DEAD/DEAH box helicase family protein [Methyloprofundus sp.]|nr:DEAD/DEAH box helicase family protein [Methyloprofundus sp.]